MQSTIIISHMDEKSAEEQNPQSITLDDIVEKLRGDSGWLREFRVEYYIQNICSHSL